MSKSEKEELLEEYGQYQPVIFVEFIGIHFMKSNRGKGAEYNAKDKDRDYACIGTAAKLEYCSDNDYLKLFIRPGLSKEDVLRLLSKITRHFIKSDKFEDYVQYCRNWEEENKITSGV
jgi:hypothetical protein